jgi:iron complex transport system substrate-binding protein
MALNRVTLQREGYPMAFQNGSRVVTFDRKPTRILALGLGASELLIELGLSHLMIARTFDWFEGKPLPKYAIALAGIPRIAPENILTLETQNNGPDFVYGLFDDSTPDPPFLKSYHTLATTKTQFFAEVRDLAKLLKVEDKALAFIAEQEKRLRVLSFRLADAYPVKVLVVLNLSEGSLLTAGGQEFSSDLIKLAGGRNVFADLGPTPKPNVNEVVARNPNFILIVDDGRTPLTDKIVALQNDPVLSLLPAVSEYRFLTLHESYLLPGPRLADSVELIAKQLHPSLVH